MCIYIYIYIYIKINQSFEETSAIIKILLLAKEAYDQK